MANICQIKGCNNQASHITTTETNYIEVCKDCYQSKYKS